MSTSLDEQLRAEGGHYHREAEATTGNLHDVDVRTARQRRHQRLATGSAAAVAVVLVAVLINRQTAEPPPFPAVDTGVSTAVTAAPEPAPGPATTVAPGPGPDATTAAPESRPTASDPTTSATTTTRATAPDIRTIDFANLTYPADSCPGAGLTDPPSGGFPLREGRYGDDPGGPRVYLQEERHYGDVTGDGLEDAAISLACFGGTGSGSSMNPWVFAADGTAPGGIRRLPYPPLTAADFEAVGLPLAEPYQGTVAGMAGTLTVEWIVGAGGEPHMYTIVATPLRWDGRGWQRAGAPTVLQRPVIDQ